MSFWALYSCTSVKPSLTEVAVTIVPPPFFVLEPVNDIFSEPPPSHHAAPTTSWAPGRLIVITPSCTLAVAIPPL